MRIQTELKGQTRVCLHVTTTFRYKVTSTLLFQFTFTFLFEVLSLLLLLSLFFTKSFLKIENTGTNYAMDLLHLRTPKP